MTLQFIHLLVSSSFYLFNSLDLGSKIFKETKCFKISKGKKLTKCESDACFCVIVLLLILNCDYLPRFERYSHTKIINFFIFHPNQNIRSLLLLCFGFIRVNLISVGFIRSLSNKEVLAYVYFHECLHWLAFPRLKVASM